MVEGGCEESVGGVGVGDAAANEEIGEDGQRPRREIQFQIGQRRGQRSSLGIIDLCGEPAHEFGRIQISRRRHEVLCRAGFVAHAPTLTLQKPPSGWGATRAFALARGPLLRDTN